MEPKDLLCSHASGFVSGHQGIYVIASFRMQRDLGKFLALLIPTLVAFTTAFTCAWPGEAGSPLQLNWWTTFEALFYTSISGELTSKWGDSVYPSSLLSAPPQNEEGGWLFGSLAYLFFVRGAASRTDDCDMARWTSSDASTARSRALRRSLHFW